MKLFKKIAIACLSLFTTASMATACSAEDLGNILNIEGFGNITVQAPTSDSLEDSTVSNEESSSEEEDNGESVAPQYIYRIKVQNATGYGFKNITVRLKDGNEVIAEKTTSASGYADFGRSDILALGNFDIELDDLPNGYKLSENTVKPQTIPMEGFSTNIQIEPSQLGPLSGKAPAGTRYALGDVMYDFSIKTTDDTTFTLSEVLQEKDMVLINFWATWCEPCKSEFPAMNAAYESMKDDVAVIAVTTEPSDSKSKVKDFKSKNALLFDMAGYSDAGETLAGYFDTSGIPVSIMVDRYGVITYYHMGSMTAAIDFTSRFNRFVGDDYQPTVLSGALSEEEGEGGENGDNKIKPTVDFPSLTEIQSVLNNGGDFTFAWDTDEYAWPWIITQDSDGDTVVQASVKLDGNYATMKATFTAQAGDTFLFDYDLLTEENCDIFYILIDGVPAYQLSGRKAGTASYVFRDFEAGEHTLHFLYLKDGDKSIEGEHVNISNFRLENNSENAEGLVFQHAANAVNVDKDGNLIDETKNSYYQYYETVVLNSEDGYYHVGTEDGPILFANLMLSSRWSDTSVWLLAYADFVVSEGYNFHADIEDYAWEANQPIPNYGITYGYTPVTEGLRALLEHAARSTPIKEYGYKYWTGDYHENEWLEMCVYWQNYGATPALDDPMKTITFHAAEEVYSGVNGSVKNTAVVQFAMTPRGFKYKFTPEVSGVYNVYSTGDEDTTCFLVAQDQTTFLGEYTDVIGKTKTVYNEETGVSSVVLDSNFYFHYYFEAGTTYYLLLTTHIEDGYASYPFFIDYVGDEYSYLENLAVGPYSFNEVSGKTYLPDAKSVAFDETVTLDMNDDGVADINGAYRIVDENGNMGGIIYVDMVRATAFFTQNALFDTAKADRSKPLEERNFYINGVDYTDTIFKYGNWARNRLEDDDPNTPALSGFIELDETLFKALYAITCSERFGGLSNEAWQMLCYYYRTVKA